jgi:predicted flavoprotein YhiN
MYLLGVITGASGGYSNQILGASGVGAPFVIPKGVRAIYLQPGQSGLRFEFGTNTAGTGGTFQTTQARGAQLAGPDTINGPFRVNRTDSFPVVNCRVYSGPTE